MRPGLYLHVGTHKTGTTSFQSFMQDQRDDLCAGGVEPWLDKTGEANAWRLAHHFLRPELQTPVRLNGRIKATPTDALSQFETHVTRSDKAVHLVSSEAFCFARTDQEADALRAGLGDLFCWIRPILVLRSQAAWRRSWDEQLRKTHVAEALDKVPPQNRISADWYFDRRAILEFWQGIGTTTCLDYDLECARYGSILPALKDAVDLSDVPLRESYLRNLSQIGSTTPLTSID